DCAHAFPVGHRIRIAVSTSYFPLAWTAPEPVTMTLVTGRSTVTLPVRAPRDEDARLADFPPPEMAPMPEMAEIIPGEGSRHVERNLATGEQVVRIVEDGGAYHIEAINLDCADGMTAEFTILEDDPTSARGIWRWTTRRTRDDWDISMNSQMAVTVSKEAFHIATDLEAFEGDKRIYSRRWNHDVPRDHI
ncbi:MAG: CocE/NonD family hydrolase C-terminal non-catalytic domain-containing protein, partial [Alphaproteobacteria bacterium]